ERAGRRSLTQTFVVSKEIQVLPLQNRSAQAAAELVALETRLRDMSAVVIPGVGVEHVVPKKIEASAVELVAAPFGHDGDYASVSPPVLRVKGGSGYLDFLNGIDRWRGERSAPLTRLARNAVDEDRSRLIATAVQGKPVVVLILRGLRDARADGHNAGCRPNQHERVPHVG